MEFNLAIEQLTDIELEDTLRFLQMDLRWKRNRAYAVQPPQSTQLMIAVKEEKQVKKLHRGRERRIIRGTYQPFT
jgi:hypothetical protein